MQYSFLIGESLNIAKEYADKHKIKVVFIETKDRYNDYENKRIIRIKQLGNNELEIIYTGFPDYKE